MSFFGETWDKILIYAYCKHIILIVLVSREIAIKEMEFVGEVVMAKEIEIIHDLTCVSLVRKHVMK